MTGRGGGKIFSSVLREGYEVTRTNLSLSLSFYIRDQTAEFEAFCVIIDERIFSNSSLQNSHMVRGGVVILHRLEHSLVTSLYINHYTRQKLVLTLLFLSSNRVNLPVFYHLAFYHQCRSLIGYSTRCLFS